MEINLGKTMRKVDGFEKIIYLLEEAISNGYEVSDNVLNELKQAYNESECADKINASFDDSEDLLRTLQNLNESGLDIVKFPLFMYKAAKLYIKLFIYLVRALGTSFVLTLADLNRGLLGERYIYTKEIDLKDDATLYLFEGNGCKSSAICNEDGDFFVLDDWHGSRPESAEEVANYEWFTIFWQPSVMRDGLPIVSK